MTLDDYKLWLNQLIAATESDELRVAHAFLKSAREKVDEVQLPGARKLASPPDQVLKSYEPHPTTPTWQTVPVDQFYYSPQDQRLRAYTPQTYTVTSGAVPNILTQIPDEVVDSANA